MGLLEEACIQGKASAVLGLLNMSDTDVNDISGGATPLAHACKHGHLEVVQALLNAKDIDVNLGVAKNLSSPLMVAASLGHTGVVQALVTHKRTDVNKARRDGVTPIIIAVQQSHQGALKALCSCPRLKVNARSLFPERVTALLIAIRANSVEAVRTLLAHPTMSLEENAYMRETPIEIASELGESHKDIVDLLQGFANGDVPQPCEISSAYEPAVYSPDAPKCHAAIAPKCATPQNAALGTTKESQYILDLQERFRQGPSAMVSQVAVQSSSLETWSQSCLILSVILRENLDATDFDFAGGIYTVLVEVSRALVAACADHSGNADAKISINSASINYKESPRSKSLVIESEIMNFDESFGGGCARVICNLVDGGEIFSGLEATFAIKYCAKA